MHELSTLFWAARGTDTPPSEELEQELATVVARVRAALPDLPLVPGDFVAELARRIPEEGDAIEAVRRTHAEDLFLALRCAAGDSRALSRFEEHLVPDLKLSLRRMGLSGSAIDDAVQELRLMLFVPSPGARAKILSYSGRGALRGWLRAVGGRTALRALRRSGRALEPAPVPAFEMDPELDYLRQRYAEPFAAAYRSAVLAMPARESVLLKQRFQHGLSLEELGSMYAVHPSTMSRRVTLARERLVALTREAMMQGLNVSRAEASSILRLVQREVDINLSQSVPLAERDSNGGA